MAEKTLSNAQLDSRFRIEWLLGVALTAGVVWTLVAGAQEDIKVNSEKIARLEIKIQDISVSQARSEQDLENIKEDVQELKQGVLHAVELLEDIHKNNGH